MIIRTHSPTPRHFRCLVNPFQNNPTRTAQRAHVSKCVSLCVCQFLLPWQCWRISDPLPPPSSLLTCFVLSFDHLQARIEKARLTPPSNLISDTIQFTYLVVCSGTFSVLSLTIISYQTLRISLSLSLTHGQRAACNLGWRSIAQVDCKTISISRYHKTLMTCQKKI